MSYVTRGRAAEIEAQLHELRGELLARVDVLERRVAHAEGLALEVVRAQATAALEVYKGLQSPPRKESHADHA